MSESLRLAVKWCAAYLACVALVLWGAQLVSSIDRFRNPREGLSDPIEASSAAADLLMYVILSIFALSLVWVLMREQDGFGIPRYAPWLADMTGRSRFLASAGLFIVGSGLSQLVVATMSSEGAQNLPTAVDYSSPAQWMSAAGTLLAGAAEEPMFAALPILLVYKGRFPVGAVIVLSASARAVLHIYQGVWPAVGAFVWGAVAVYAYYRFRSLTGLIVAHGVHNLIWLAGLAEMRWLMGAGLAATMVAAVGYFVVNDRFITRTGTVGVGPDPLSTSDTGADGRGLEPIQHLAR